MPYKYLYILFVVALLSGCSGKKKKEMTPWGTVIGGDSAATTNTRFSLDDIVNNGEMIMLTMTGPETYYDYRGHGMGLQYLLCEKFAQSIGVSLRVEVCKDTAEMVKRLNNGDGDIIAYPLPKTIKGVKFCGADSDNGKEQWAVKGDNEELADRLNAWFKPELTAQVRREEAFLLSSKSVTRHVYSPMLNRSGGIISRYDALFRQYAPVARIDWRLMAAQCYQESTFDPRAHSWAGACGLMQIMPRTAAHLGLAVADIYDPERNIAASAKYLQELGAHFSDIENPVERSYFVLASYNGGFFHIRDAMALARKYGKSPYRWSDVAEYVQNLSRPEFYRDPVVKYGYMRGNETVDYVSRIRDRYLQYRGVARGGGSDAFGGGTPQRAKRKYRFHV
ncbi:transglycosylase SLT domain-containing protein [Hoylesella oralis]|uniref:transglycosylase SLT domain-containing protein n=1 Tax=Hoylesella oralis TaxID=28134 RepID=UPI0028E18877|nr:transglycosylase SLT domain-containing protein [Hoylesella oralis]